LQEGLLAELAEPEAAEAEAEAEAVVGAGAEAVAGAGAAVPKQGVLPTGLPVRDTVLVLLVRDTVLVLPVRDTVLVLQDIVQDTVQDTVQGTVLPTGLLGPGAPSMGCSLPADPSRTTGRMTARQWECGTSAAGPLVPGAR